MKVICLHGFLGTPDDFSFLDGYCHYIALDLNKYIDHSLSETFLEIQKFITKDEKVLLLGYSFGARLAIQLFCHSPETFSQLILLAGHAGLMSSKEREERVIIEKAFLSKIETMSNEEFIKYWNDLSLFDADEKLTDRKINKNNLMKYFQNWGLSKQPYLKDELLKQKNKVKWFFGSRDEKYAQYARENLREFSVEYVPNAGHRLIKNNDFLETLKGELKC